jgi:uncharacterized protein YkwD
MKMSLRTISIILISTVLLAGVGVYLAQAQKPTENAYKSVQSQPVVKTPEVIPLDPNKILELVNIERAKVGVAPLVSDPRLVATAQARADDMVARNYFAHRDPITNENMVKAQPFCVYTSENIVWIKYQTPAEDNQESVDWWMNSKPHREAMLNNSNSLVGIAINSQKVVMHLCQQ